MPVWAISCKVQKGLNLHMVETYILMRGGAEGKNHNPILQFT